MTKRTMFQQTFAATMKSFKRKLIINGVNDVIDSTIDDSILSSEVKMSGLGIKITLGDFLYQLIHLSIGIKNCTSILEFIDAVYNCLAALMQKTHLEMIKTFSKYIAKLFMLVFDRDFTALSQSSDMKETKTFIKELRSITGNFEKFQESEFARRGMTFLAFVLTLPLCKKHNIGGDWLGFEELALRDMERQRKKQHKFSFSVGVIDSTLFLTEKLIEFTMTKDASRILYDDEILRKYKRFLNWVLFYQDKLDLLSSEFYVDFDTEEQTVQKCTLRSFLATIETLEKLNKDLKGCFTDKTICGKLKSELDQLELAKRKVLFKMNVDRERDAPFAIGLISSPGVGKSQIALRLLKIHSDFRQATGRQSHSFDPKLVYNYNYNDEFMSGFTSAHDAIVVDDLGQFNKAITEARKGEAMAELIGWINPTPYVTNQAELENKGRIPFLCHSVLITSNFKDMGLNKVYETGGGIYRRIPLVFVRVKEEFRKEGESQLLGDLNNPHNQDLYEYIVRKYVNVDGANIQKTWDPDSKEWIGNTSSKMVLNPMVRPMDIFEFSAFYRDHFLIPHYSQIDRAKVSSNYFLKSGPCSICNITKVFCKCSVTQSSNERELPHHRDTIVDDDEPSMGHCALLEYQYQHSSEYLNRLVTFGIACTILPFLVFSDVCSHLIGFSPIRNFIQNWIHLPLLDAVEYLIVGSYSPWDFDGKFMSNQRKRLYSYLVSARERTSGTDYLLALIRRQRRSFLVKAGVATIMGLMSIYVLHNSFASRSEDEEEEDPDEIIEEQREENPNPPAVSQMESLKKISEEKDYWSPGYQDMSKFDGSCKNVTLTQLKNLLPRNILLIRIESKTKLFNVNVLGIKGMFGIFPKHTYLVMKKYGFNFRYDIYRHNSKTNLGSSCFNIILDETCFIDPDDGSDYVFIKHAAFGTFRDISKFFLTQRFNGITKGVAIGRNAEGDILEVEIMGLTSKLANYHDVELNKHFEYPAYLAYAKEATNPGFCGAPYIIQGQNGFALAGFHVAYSADRHLVYCTTILQEQLSVIDKQFNIASFNGIELQETYATTQSLFVEKELHKKSALRDIKEQCSLHVYGNLNLPNPALRTSVCGTIMQRDVLEYHNMILPDFVSPKGVNSKTCLKNTIAKMGVKSSIPPGRIDRAVTALTDHYKDVIKENHIEIPRPCSLDIAVNGLDGLSYVNRLPIKTSGGFGHRGPKSKYLILGEPCDDHDTYYSLNDDVLSEVNRALERAARLESTQAVFDMNFKDEPISIEKVLKDKCRIFNSAPLFFSIIMRMYYLNFIPLFYGKYRHLFGCAMGCNVYGKDWTVFYKHIVRFGSDRIIAGDHGSFDKRMQADMILGAFRVLIGLAKDSGYSEEEINIMTTIATDSSFPLTNAFGALVQFYGTNPSGMPLTTIINSIVNILYIMISCEIIAEEAKMPFYYERFFSDYISLLTNGDDNIMSSNVDIFNHSSLASTLAKFGLEYTMADKASASVPFIDIMEAGFLKRFFWKDKIRKGLVAAPLLEESIIKMTTVCTRSKTICFEQQNAEIIMAASREYFQYGKKKFNEMRDFFELILQKYHLYPYLPQAHLDTWEELSASIFDDEPAVTQSSNVMDYLSLECGCLISVNSYTIVRELNCTRCHCDHLWLMCGDDISHIFLSDSDTDYSESETDENFDISNFEAGPPAVSQSSDIFWDILDISFNQTD